MLIKHKTRICFGIFVILFIAGWRAHLSLPENPIVSAPRKEFEQIGAFSTEPANEVIFLPREYLRIVRVQAD